jgi:cobyrinic acid a,c-diamide synthase
MRWSGPSQERLYDEKLSRFGYITLTARYPNLLAAKDQCIQAHEFHYSTPPPMVQTFIARKPAPRYEWTCIHADADLFAGYPHLHFWGNIQMAVNFVLRAAIPPAVAL